MQVAAIVAVVIVFAIALTGCNLLPDTKEVAAGWSAERIYKEGHDAMRDGNYTEAIKLFDTLEGRYPYGRFAQQAILEAAYSSYRANESAAAIAACDRFIRTYPNHPNVDYAYYLKGLVNFRENQGLFGYVVELDLSERDPKASKESFDTFKELVTRFPQSSYAADAQERMRYLTNALATYEVHVATYYFNRKAYLAAANRAQTVITNFPRTPANEPALILMIKSYDKLDLPQLRDDTTRILKDSFPQSKYLAGAGGSSWWKFW